MVLRQISAFIRLARALLQCSNAKNGICKHLCAYKSDVTIPVLSPVFFVLFDILEHYH